MLVALKKSIAWHLIQGFRGGHERKVEAIGEHNFEHSRWQLGRNNRRQAEQMRRA